MIKSIRTLAWVLSMLFLFGCDQETKDYSWYMLHPLALKEEVTTCQTNALSGKNVSQCKMIMQAAYDMTEIVNEQQREPEQFGQRVMDEEYRLQRAQENKDEKVYREQLQRVNVLMAVLSLSSPS